VVRARGADWFRPKAMMAARDECDFVQGVAVNYPLYVIMSLLGLPESDFPRMLTLTQELFGGDDDEFK
jgi:cytochrome P450